MTDPSTDRPGAERFGQYTLLKRLAVGGMGEIFLAKQQGPAGFERIAALKRILEKHLGEPKYVELFLTEARVAALLSHPNIVHIYDLGQVAGTAFIAMEYVHGQPLTALIKASRDSGRALPLTHCAELVSLICDGLSYAHSLCDADGQPLNLVHRDVNPYNILVGYSGEVKLIDFGLAKTTLSTQVTEAGALKGKFDYMSPEQCASEPVDQRSDIFTLTIVLYELLSGVNPFYRDTPIDGLIAIQKEEPRPISSLRPEAVCFEPILARGLAKDRAQRYQTCDELQQALQELLRSETLPPAELTFPELLAIFFSREIARDRQALLECGAAEAIGHVQIPFERAAAPARQQEFEPELTLRMPSQTGEVSSFPVADEETTRLPIAQAEALVARLAVEAETVPAPEEATLRAPISAAAVTTSPPDTAPEEMPDLATEVLPTTPTDDAARVTSRSNTRPMLSPTTDPRPQPGAYDASASWLRHSASGPRRALPAVAAGAALAGLAGWLAWSLTESSRPLPPAGGLDAGRIGVVAAGGRRVPASAPENPRGTGPGSGAQDAEPSDTTLSPVPGQAATPKHEGNGTLRIHLGPDLTPSRGEINASGDLVLPLRRAQGRVELKARGDRFRVVLGYEVQDGEVRYRVSARPRAKLRLNGKLLGRTPRRLEPGTRFSLELEPEGGGAAVKLQVAYKPPR